MLLTWRLSNIFTKKYDHKNPTSRNHSDIWEGQFVKVYGVTLLKNR